MNSPLDPGHPPLYRCHWQEGGRAAAAQEATENSVSFIVPALNEEQNIGPTMQSILRTVEQAGLDDYQIVMVNDGSVDGTGTVMKRLAAEDPLHRIYVENRVNLGLGGAFKAGVAAANRHWAMLIPGDDSHPPEGILPILAQRGPWEMVIPYVTNTEARPWERRVISRIYTALFNGLGRVSVPYFNGLILYRRDLLQAVGIETDSYAFQAEALIKLIHQGRRFTTLGVVISGRQHGRSKAFNWRNLWQIGQTLWRVWNISRRAARSQERQEGLHA
ncbi:MAG: glycosyltransferase family 2 protein [Magnetococcales bacterium]|nr:glycosyltransferase family 2 protein [Magnetococcales bacterium]